MHTIISLISGFVLFAVFQGPHNSDPERLWHVKNESRLAISGESNINQFTCEVDNYYSADNLNLFSTSGPEYVFSGNNMVINLMEFDCGKALITKDFRETLNANEDPEIKISFLSLDRLPDKNSGNDDMSGMVEVTIAGVSNKSEIPLSMNSGIDEGTIYLQGKHTFSFSDFGLTPPSKFMGLINVKNELEVTFDIILEELPPAVFQEGLTGSKGSE